MTPAPVRLEGARCGALGWGGRTGGDAQQLRALEGQLAVPLLPVVGCEGGSSLQGGGCAVTFPSHDVSIPALAWESFM